MSLIKNNALVGASGQGDYFIDRSLRFRSSASAYLNRTPASAGNRKTWTWSGWVKRGKLTTQQVVIGINSASTNIFTLSFLVGDTLRVFNRNSGVDVLNLTSSSVYRDPSSWYHIVIQLDTTQATSADRAKLFVNGVQLTSFSTATYPSQNLDLVWNSNSYQHEIGRESTGSYLDGYLTEINFIDGQALDASSFGEYNSDTGVWQPKKYGGAYGTNGFYLNFSDNSTTTTLGYDTSGNSNNWTANNISVTSGATYDSMTDVPTLTSEDAANYATLNPLADVASSPNYGTLSNANLKHTESGSGTGNYLCTMAIPSNSGKWYFEITADTLMPTYAYYPVMGLFPVGSEAAATLGFAGYNVEGLAYYSSGGYYVNNSTSAGSGTSISAGQTRCFAYDSDTGKLWIRTNGGAWENSGDPDAGTNPFATLDGALDYFPYAANSQSSSTHNFGQRPFAYTPPTGFKSLNTYNLPDSTIENGGEYFNTVLYTGTGPTPLSVTGVGFQPDWVWLKRRNNAGDHWLFDQVRGVEKLLETSTTDAELNLSQTLISFDADGFSLGTNTSYNSPTHNVVAWNWKANGSGVSNTDGIITSTVSANPTAGFSISTFTTPSSFTNATVGHGLSASPAMLIVKRRTTGDWITWHQSLGANGYLTLNTTSASASNSGSFNGTSSTTWTMGSSAWWQASASDWVCYAFAEVEGYSKFGSYTGNGSSTDGPFVYTGFRPAFVMFKRTNSTENWLITDNARNTSNVITNRLYPNLSAAEDSGTPVDFLSNGFKIRAGAATPNVSGGTYIYMAFAENPFKNALAR